MFRNQILQNKVVIKEFISPIVFFLYCSFIQQIQDIYLPVFYSPPKTSLMLCL